MKKIAFLGMTLLAFFTIKQGFGKQGFGVASPKQELREFLKAHYLNAAYNELQMEKLYEGFHPDFFMVWIDEGQVKTLDFTSWVKIIAAQIKDDIPRSFQYEFKRISLDSQSATVEIDLFQAGRLMYKDTLFLKRNEEQWVVVHKYFTKADQ